MAFLPLAISGVSALGGALSNRGQTTSQTPVMSSDQQRLLDMLISQYTNASQRTNMSGFAATQTDDINHMAELEKRKLQETLAARGITGSAVNYAKGRVDSDRFADITKLRQSLPFMQQDQQFKALGAGASLFSAIPSGGKTTTPGNMAAGGIGGGASTLAYFLGQGAFKKPGTVEQPTQYSQNFQAPTGGYRAG